MQAPQMKVQVGGIRHPPTRKPAVAWWPGLAEEPLSLPNSGLRGFTYLYNGKQPGLPWCPAAGGPAASGGGAYLCVNLTFELSQLRGSHEPLGAATSECCYLCAAAPGCKVWLLRGWETISEDGSGCVHTNRALRKDSGLSGDLKEGDLRSWQLWHCGAGSGMDTQVHPVTVGIAWGRGDGTCALWRNGGPAS